MLLEYCNQPFMCIACRKYRETCVEIHVRKPRMEKSRNQGNIGHKARNNKKNTLKRWAPRTPPGAREGWRHRLCNSYTTITTYHFNRSLGDNKDAFTDWITVCKIKQIVRQKHCFTKQMIVVCSIYLFLFLFFITGNVYCWWQNSIDTEIVWIYQNIYNRRYSW